MKKVLAFLLAAAMVLSLAACGGQKDPSSDAPAAPKELRFVTGGESGTYKETEGNL